MYENSVKDIISCPECGFPIDSEITVCYECGFPIDTLKKENTIPSVKSAISARQLGITLCVVAAICLIIGITRITNDKYNFYSEHYTDCMEGYAETQSSADSFSSGMFKQSYQSIADDYIDMANDDLKKIWTFRVEAILLILVGTACGFVGFKKINLREEQ